MPNLFSKDSGISTAHSMSMYGVSGPSWLSSTESRFQQSAMSGSLSLKMAIPPQHFNPKQSSFQFQDPESSSTQSTGQSSSKEASVKDGNPNGQSIISASSGFNGSHIKPEGGDVKLVSSIGPQEFVFTPPHVDHNQSVAPFQLHYTEPYFSGLLSPFLPPQAMIHYPQMMGMAHARVPLPLELTEDEPIYVNAKQYRAILRRRQYRAKLEAQNKLIKGRKPYLHESRHVHAMNRARGSGGRFLNKKLQASEPNPTNNGLDMSESEVHRENYKDCGSTPSCSDITSVSNSEDIFQRPEFGFSGYSSHMGSRSMQGCSADINCNGNLHRFLSSVER